jgi:hypothetical protein
MQRQTNVRSQRTAKRIPGEQGFQSLRKVESVKHRFRTEWVQWFREQDLFGGVYDLWG